MTTKSIYESAAAIIKVLKKKSLSISVAESITGGGVGHALTSIPGSSEVFVGGVIAYSDQLKVDLLDVEKKVIKKHTPCSEEVAIQMAVGIQRATGSDYAIATTGVAGPGKAYGFKSGTVWVGIATPPESKTPPFAFLLEISASAPGLTTVQRREEIRNTSITSALAAFERILLS